jgi:hypothetical protein
MSKQGDLELLQNPVAKELLVSTIPASFAYTWSDGTVALHRRDGARVNHADLGGHHRFRTAIPERDRVRFRGTGPSGG